MTTPTHYARLSVGENYFHGAQKFTTGELVLIDALQKLALERATVFVRAPLPAGGTVEIEVCRFVFVPVNEIEALATTNAERQGADR